MGAARDNADGPNLRQCSCRCKRVRTTCDLCRLILLRGVGRHNHYELIDLHTYMLDMWGRRSTISWLVSTNVSLYICIYSGWVCRLCSAMANNHTPRPPTTDEYGVCGANNCPKHMYTTCVIDRCIAGYRAPITCARIASCTTCANWAHMGGTAVGMSRHT